ncbi:MAG: zinc protease, partial [Campylobacterota bacterium]|nr:zinc protease [Campylobacterota bacterium]
DFIYSIEGASNVSNLFGSFLAKGDITPLLTYESDIDALDLKTIQNVSNKYFDSKNSTTLILKKEAVKEEE